MKHAGEERGWLLLEAVVGITIFAILIASIGRLLVGDVRASAFGRATKREFHEADPKAATIQGNCSRHSLSHGAILECRNNKENREFLFYLHEGP